MAGSFVSKYTWIGFTALIYIFTILYTYEGCDCSYMPKNGQITLNYLGYLAQPPSIFQKIPFFFTIYSMLSSPLQMSQTPCGISNKNSSLLFGQVTSIHDVFQGFCLSLRLFLRATTNQGTKQDYATMSLSGLWLNWARVRLVVHTLCVSSRPEELWLTLVYIPPEHRL